MKQGKSLMELGMELQRQRNNRQDFIADTKSLEVQTDSNGNSQMFFYLDGINDNAHSQISARLGIPYRYYQRMQKETPDLLDNNINTWLVKNPERRMIRVLDGNVRAFLSDRYRRLDNLELCAAVLPVIKEMKNATIESCEVTPTHLYLKVINKKLKAEVAVGDVVQAGFVVSNSEVGLGSLRVEPLVFRLVCKNGMICKDLGKKKYHVGRQINDSDDKAYEIYRDAFFMKVQDIVRCAVDEAQFMLTVDKMREAMHIPISHEPQKAVEVLADKFQFTEMEKSAILCQLFMDKDLSRYGLVNAVTATSKMSQSYERATELERIGGEILSLPVPRNLLPPANSVIDIEPTRQFQLVA